MVMRFTHAFVTGIAVVVLALGSGLLLGGYKSDDAAQPAGADAKPAAAEKPAAAKGAAAPAGHRMSKLAANMSPQQVQEIMGAPTGEASYPSAKTFMPYNFGGDTGNRVEYKYKGEGRVVFAVPRYGGNMKVVRIDYDPTEDGN